jgi:hypothetical protein
MPDEKKDVATKLAPIVEKLKKLMDGALAGQESIKAYDMGLANKIEGNSCMNALRAIFKRQIDAQYGAHGLKTDEFHSIQPGTRLKWDDKWMQYMTMWLDSMIDETEETRNWLNWKCWKKPKEITDNDIKNARFELIDLLHFWINAYFMLGGTPDTLVVEYHAKRDENDDRQKNGY